MRGKYGAETRESIPSADDSSRLLSHCLSLDLEVGVKDRRIRAFAGVRPDTGQSLAFPIAGNSLAGAFAKLDDLAGGAEFLLGHNLIEFDLPHLKAASPNLGLLRLPAVDTLRLNPLAFPRNPYHHLGWQIITSIPSFTLSATHASRRSGATASAFITATRNPCRVRMSSIRSVMSRVPVCVA